MSATDNTPDKDLDDKFNPALSLLEQEQKGADSIWDDQKNIDSDEVKSNEENGLYQPSQSVGSKGKSLNGRFSFKKKGATGAIISMVLGGGALVGTFVPSLAGISFIQNSINDLGDRIPALTISSDGIMRNKLVKSAKSGSLRGCTKASISCKLKTFSKSELARLERAGIKVNTDGKSWSGRSKAVSIEFRDSGPLTPDQWNTELRTNSAARNAQLRANNMKYRGLSVNGPFGKVMARFNITKKAPGLSGDKKSRLNQLLTSTGAADTSKMKLADIVDENGESTGKKALTTDGSTKITMDVAEQNGFSVYEGDAKIKRIEETIAKNASPNTSKMKLADIVDENGESTGKKALTTDGSTKITMEAAEQNGFSVYEGDSQIKRIEETIAKNSSPKTGSLSATKKASLGAASILGVADLTCSIKNMIIGASVAAKITNEMRLVQYAMPLASSIGKINAGEGTPEDAETIGDFLTQTDTRTQIESISASGEGIDVSGNSITTSDSSLVSINNPNYGKSAMDSALLSMSINGGVAPPSETRAQYAVSMGTSSIFSSIAGGVVSFAKGGPLSEASDITCNIIQNPLVRTGGIVLSVVAGIGSLGSISTVQVVTVAAMIASMVILESTIESSLSGNQLAGLSTDTVGRGEALWTGLASIEGATSRATGMQPGDVESLEIYNNLANDVKDRYASMEKEDAKNNPLDITNQYSFMGSFVRSIASATNYSSNLLSFIPGSIMASLNNFNPLKTANATTGARFDPERFQQSDDSEYIKLGIDPDVQGNVRYYISPEVQKLLEDPDAVSNYMEDNGFVAVDTETGMPEGYTPPNLQADQQKLSDMVIGNVSEMTIGQFFSTKNYPNDYARWIETCPLRTAPFGKTGEETQTIGGLGDDWDTGANCIKNTNELNHFRAYWILLSTIDVNDEEEDFSKQNSDSDATNSSVSSPDDLPPSDGWVWPIKDSLKPGPCWGVNVGSLGKHAGMDINSGMPNAPIYAMHDGVVVSSSPSDSGAAGKYIKVKATNGMYYMYQHLSSVGVKNGDTVRANQHVGTGGKTGRVYASSPVHLHLVVSKTESTPSYGNLKGSVNPMSVLPSPAPNNYKCY